MKYQCKICGYVYDDSKEGVPFASLPDTWQCPLCGAPKSAFELMNDTINEKVAQDTPKLDPPSVQVPTEEHDLQRLSVAQLAALCSNLARGCEKLYMSHEQTLFNELADWFTAHSPHVPEASVDALASQFQSDVASYPQVNQTGKDHQDRGAQRVCVWGEKVTRMLEMLVDRYRHEGEALLAQTNIWVCTACGFVYIGDTAPELCPVCKVPNWKFNKIEGRV